MHSAAPRPDEPSTNEPQGARQPTPQELADDLRTLAAEVGRRVEEWHGRPDWRADEQNRHRYELTISAVAALDRMPTPVNLIELDGLVKTIQPVLDEWQPSWAGPEQAIYAAVDRARTAVTRIALVVDNPAHRKR
jgi:hypothetical protein